ncbi:hypothetical protein A9Q99_25310 [Gammaproteobacteria bacterium 45_16_T64]|nr:hypothetical protein A9Q99_25310 [Gammaproteobacteria bacterium 45_16_T64]
MKKYAAAALITFSTLSMLSNSVNAVPMTWGANGHEYEVIYAPSTSWSIARTQAQALGSGWDLATITSLAEQNFITSMLGPASGALIEYYIGGVFTTEWTWVTGEIFDFTYWGAGEPNNNAGEPHIALDGRFNAGNWGWNDYTGAGSGFVHGYVVEKHTIEIAEPGTLSLFGLGLLMLGLRRRYTRR